MVGGRESGVGPKTNSDAQAALEQLVDGCGSKSQVKAKVESREMLKQRKAQSTKSQTISSSLNSQSTQFPRTTAKKKVKSSKEKKRKIQQRKPPFQVLASV